MALFNGNSADDKARAFAGKKGVDVSGATAVGRTYQDGSGQVLAVYPGRVDVYHLGKTASLLKKGGGCDATGRGAHRGGVDPGDGVWGVVSIEGVGHGSTWTGHTAPLG